jgi:hypothetical protein
MNTATITMNGHTISLRYGMASFRYLTERFVEGISFINDELNEIGLSHILYSGYINYCLVKDIKKDYTFEFFVDYIETHLKDEDFMAQVMDAVKVWADSEYIKQAQEVKDEEAKKKSSRGKK